MREGEGARLGSGEPQQQLHRLSFGSVLCFSFPDQEVCPQGCPGCAMQGVGGEGSGGAGGFQRTQVHSFIPSRARFQAGYVLVCLCSHCCMGVTWGLVAFGGVSG